MKDKIENKDAENVAKGFRMNMEIFLIEDYLQMERERLYQEAQERIYGKDKAFKTDT